MSDTITNDEQRETSKQQLHTDKDIARWQPWLFLPLQEGPLAIPTNSRLVVETPQITG